MTSKIRFAGAQRACSAQETINRMRPHFEAAGITRVSDITDLDYIGVPVAQCIRPDAIMLSVDSGKGLTPEAARASAMMEGFERHVGESAELTSVLSTATALGDRAEYRFQLLKGASFGLDKEFRWTEVHGLESGASVMVPLVTVKMVSRQEMFPIFHACFTATSNGLSSGNTRDEAVAGGLYEVVERDQVTLSNQDAKNVPMVDLETVTDETLKRLIERLELAGIQPVLFDCTQDIGIPTFTACIYDRLGHGAYKGYAAHLDPIVAQCRALSEAIQGRAVFRAGSRDDILHASFQEHFSNNKVAVFDALGKDCATVSSNRHKDASKDTFSGDIAVILERIKAAGLPEPLCKEFDHPYPCSVVRILAPGMHGYLHKFAKQGDRPSK